MTRPARDPGDPGDLPGPPEPPGPGSTVDTAYLGIARVPGPRVADPQPPGPEVPVTWVPESPPPIDAAELAGLRPLADHPTGVRRVSPLQEPPSNLIARYLFPTERFRGEWRRHLIHLSTPVSVGVLATIGLGLLGGYVGTSVDQQLLDAAWVTPLTVLAWFGVMAWVGWRVMDWHFDRFILTNKRVMVVSGIITRNVAMMPLARVTDMKYEQTPTARILNYGTFVLESAGQDQALREIPHLPNPNELYLRVVEEMYEPQAVEDRLHPEGEDREDQLGDA